METNWSYRLVYLPLSAVITPLKGVTAAAIHPSPNVDYEVDYLIVVGLKFILIKPDIRVS